jgi:hypothetical protein
MDLPSLYNGGTRIFGLLYEERRDPMVRVSKSRLGSTIFMRVCPADGLSSVTVADIIARCETADDDNGQDTRL